MKHNILLALTATSVATAQQVYIPVNGSVSRTACSSNNTYQTTIPSFTFRQFSFTQTETVRTATSRPSPNKATTYAPAYSSLSSLVPNLTTSQWGQWTSGSNATATDAGSPYGNASWSALWATIPWVNFTRGMYSTTVQPTPVPTSELVLPPPEVLTPQGCYMFPPNFMLGVAASACQIEGMSHVRQIYVDLLTLHRRRS